MLNIGLIGLGPEWENCYRPALAKLRPRLRVRSVYAAVISQAEQVAAEFDCDVSPGLVSLMEREDIQALLVLDAAWYAGVPAEFACAAGKPAFLAGPLAHRLPVADQLLRQAATTGVTLMPDFGHRYTPATSRLRELIATRLGRPLSIVVDVILAQQIPGSTIDVPVSARQMLAAMIDWCTNLVGTTPGNVRAEFAPPVAPGANHGLPQMDVEFRRPAAGGESATACIRFAGPDTPRPTPAGSETSSIGLSTRVLCQNGSVWLDGAQRLTWRLDGEQIVESLSADRPAVEVMLDHFTRRVVGGLIPVPTLADWCQAFELVDRVLDDIPRACRGR